MIINLSLLVGCCLAFSEVAFGVPSINHQPVPVVSRFPGLVRPNPSGMKSGDLKIAFLAPLRYMNKETGRCEKVCDMGLNLAEVAVYAAQKANEEILNGTGVSIGLQIMDSCPGMAKILTNLMLPMAEEAECPLQKRQFRPTSRAATTLGIVGLDNMNEVQEYSDFAMHFNIPAITYQASGYELAKKTATPFLFRSVPCTSKLYAAMARQIEAMNPESLGVVVEDTEYGNKGKEVLMESLAEKGVTNVKFEMIPSNATKEDVFKAVSNLTNQPGSASLLAFVISEECTPTIMEALSMLDVGSLRPIIGPSPFANYLNISNAKKFENMVVVRHTLHPIPGFEEHYRGLCTKGGNTPWWHEKWEALTGPKLQEKREICAKNVPRKPKFQFASNAIYAFAHALKRFVSTSCSATDKSTCAQYLAQCWARESFLGHLRSINFSPLGSDFGHRFTFDADQDVEANYEMVQLKVRSSIVQWDAPLQ